MVKWTDNINGEPYTSRGVRTVRGRVLGNTITVMWKGAGCLAYVVTTNIDHDGNRISLHNIGRLRSEPSRKEIEKEFGLVQADAKLSLGQNDTMEIKPLVYGDVDTKRAMTSIVNETIRQYKFTSLPELNAILRLYNLEADRGPKETVMFEKGGLRYWVIDKNGHRLGVPIKASAIHKKPTLKLLEDRFRLGEYLRKPFKEQLKQRIEGALAKAGGKEQFLQELQKAHITAVFRQNAEGRVYGVTYIDQENKVVFNGSDLGKSYSAAAIVESLQSQPTGGSSGSSNASEYSDVEISVKQDHHSFTPRGLLDELLSPIDPTGGENLFERKKKKKRKKLNL